MRWLSVVFLIAAMGIGWTAIRKQGAPLKEWIALILPRVDYNSFAQIRSRRDVGSRRDDPSPAEGWWHIYHPDQHHVRLERRERYVVPAVPDVEDSPSFDAASDSHATLPAPPDLVHAFALAMTGAALCWLIQVNSHIGRVRRFVGTFNQLSGGYGVGPIRPPGLHLGIRPLWILGAVAICALGGYWAAPVMLAGAAQRRYVRTTSQRLRSDLARRQREVLLRQRPTLRVPTSVYLMGACPQPNCRAPLPPEAVYCRRCGTRVSGTGVPPVNA